MAWNAFVVIVTGWLTLLGVREGVRYALFRETDQLISEDLREIDLMLNVKPFDANEIFTSINQKAEGHKQHGWFAVFFDDAGEVRWASNQAPLAALDTKLRIAVGEPISTGQFRLVQNRLPRPEARIASVRVGVSLGPIWEDIARIDRLVIAASCVVLLIAPVCGYWLAGRATRPLSEMTQVSARLRPNHLDERLPLRNSGDELDQLALTINGLLDRIAEHLLRKQELLANAAHELRTPLAAIRSSIEVTLNEPRSSDHYQEMLTDLIEELTGLEGLVNQLLLLSETEFERRHVPAQPVAFHQLVQRSVDMFRGVADARQLRLLLHTAPCVVHGTAEHLRQLVNNLLDNAIKFTPPGGQIEIALCVNSALQKIEFRVSDSGCGIPAEDQPRVFDRFYRGQHAFAGENSPQGTGLGLSICEAVVAAHQGEIQVESQPGIGTTFTVSLPLKSPKSASSEYKPLESFGE